MATNLATKVISQGSYNFNLGLEFELSGFIGTVIHDVAIPDTWEARIVNPEGIMLVVTTGITFLVPEKPIAYIPITSGILDKAGTYTYQIIKTTTSSRVKSKTHQFIVEPSEPSLTY